jgi:hypothetical protein
MIKALIKYLLSLCILLLCGYSQLSTYTYRESTYNSPIKSLKESEHASLGNEQQDQTFITPSSPSGTKKHFTIDFAEIEIEEEEEYLKGSNHFTAIFCALILGYFFRYIINDLLLCKYFFYILSNRRHLILQVFRI